MTNSNTQTSTHTNTHGNTPMETHQVIPLAQLHVSALNVRKTAPDKAADKRLMASIASLGVLQNLVVVPEGENTFGVVAGGRRLKALKTLVKQKALPAETQVRCLVTDRDAAVTEISLAENIGQEAMHPADQFEAFALLKEQGVGSEDIAAKFGVTVQVVEKRLRLGKVAAPLLKAYRNDKLTLESLMAFTVCDDHARQLACYQELADRVWPHSVKSWLLGESVDASRGIGAFVGKTAYLNAGGAGAQDLFEDTFYLSDTALVAELAQAKLDRAAKKLAKEEGGWLWINTSVERHTDSEGLVQLHAKHVSVPTELSTSIETLDKTIEAWEEQYYDDELAEGFEDEASFGAAIEAAQKKVAALEEQRDTFLQFTDTQQAYSGCLVTFNTAGKLEILRGLAHKKDIPSPNKATDSHGKAVGQGSGTQEASGAGLSRALLDDLGQYRQQAVKAALLRNPAAAADVLHYSLCVQVLSEQRWMASNLMDAGFQTVTSKTSRNDTRHGRAFDELSTARSTLSVAWLDIDEGAARFCAFRQLPKKAKDALIAFCTAQSLTIGVSGTDADQDALVAALEIDFAQYWRPTKDNYFGRLTKGQMAEQFEPLLGPEWVGVHKEAKKGVVVDNLDSRFRDASVDGPLATWMPAQF